MKWNEIFNGKRKRIEIELWILIFWEKNCDLTFLFVKVFLNFFSNIFCSSLKTKKKIEFKKILKLYKKSLTRLVHHAMSTISINPRRWNVTNLLEHASLPKITSEISKNFRHAVQVSILHGLAQRKLQIFEN